MLHNRTLYKERELDQCHDTYLSSNAWIIPWRNYLYTFVDVFGLIFCNSLVGCSPRVSRLIWMLHLSWTLPFLLPVLICICKLILAFTKLERYVWIGISWDLIFKFCERWCSNLRQLLLFHHIWAPCLSHFFGQLALIVHTEQRYYIYRDRREGGTSETVGTLKERKKISSYEVKWSNSYSKINPSKTQVIGEINFIRVGLFDSEVGDKFRSWGFGCWVV